MNLKTGAPDLYNKVKLAFKLKSFVNNELFLIKLNWNCAMIEC